MAAGLCQSARVSDGDGRWRPFAALALLIAVADAAWQALDLSWANVFKPLSALTSDGLGEGTVSAALLKESNPPTQFFVRALATLQSLFAIVLAFLFALAVRRRFQIS